MNKDWIKIAFLPLSIGEEAVEMLANKILSMESLQVDWCLPRPPTNSFSADSFRIYLAVSLIRLLKTLAAKSSIELVNANFMDRVICKIQDPAFRRNSSCETEQQF